MTRLVGIALLCIACGSYENEPAPGDDVTATGGVSGSEASGGLAGSGVPTGGVGPEGGTAGAEQGGAGGMGVGGSVATGGASPSGGSATGGTVSTGGVATGGSAQTGGTGRGGASPTGGAQTGGTLSTGGAAGMSGSAGAGGRMLWSREFSIDATPPTTAGTSARHEIRILRRVGPDDVCVTLGGAVPHGETGSQTFGYGDLLRNCLSAVPTTSPNRHEFQVLASTSTSQAGGGGYFELPEESRGWNARTVIRRITQNSWADGGVTVRETWEFWE